ncbi:MAG TPA: PASTA domain-containing protein [Gaiellaceae bacterium]|nr:PASTA domain-containing protein [Gaiellaceae bacterium]
MWVRFVPGTAGTRLATLRLTDSTGKQRDVALQGFAFGGRTRVTMTSDQGDYIGQGRSWSYTIANDEIGAGGSRQFVGFGVDGAQGDWWSADFAPGRGDILAPGTYPNATRYPFNGTGPGLDVSGNGRGCNTLTGRFTVNSATWWPDGTLRTFSVTFEQHCEGATPALRGTWEYRAGDTTPLAPWMVAGGTPPPPPKTAPACVVPRVVRLPLLSAKRAVARAHCRVGTITTAYSARVPRGRVLSQSPRPGRRLAAGARVSLVVSRGRP